MIRLAIDTGGTFTDLVGYDERTGQLFTAKSLTNPVCQSLGILDTIAVAERKDGLQCRDVTFFAHGGTAVINAIIERKGVRTALVTTAGFRDVLAIGRGNRPDLYNLLFHSSDPIVPRHLRFEVRERLDARGEVVEPLHLEDLAPIIAACRDGGVEAIGVVFLHSYANPDHERRCAQELASALPGVTVCASTSVSRQWREYERSNTVALNAYVQPLIRRYFAGLELALMAKELTCPYYAMQSNGGICTFEHAVQSPLTLVESGPAGGVAGAARIGAALGEMDVIYLDVGGTTAKCSLIQGGRPKLNADYRLEHTRTAPGYPIQVPVVDIVEIGSGGGSIAWIDARGILHAGPESAGSAPGPACFARGGVKPTLTDAVLVAGIFDPAMFGGGTMPLDLERARQAVATIAGPLGLSIEDAALAIVEIAHGNMMNALKLVTVQRGHDPRDAILIVSGGAGPALAARLGRDLNVKATVIPPHPGLFSAWGMLAAKPRAVFRGTWVAPLTEAALRNVRARFRALETEACDYFGKDQRAGIHFTYQVEARYEGQEHGVLTPFSLDDGVTRLAERFHGVHEQAYSFSLPRAAITLTALHLEAAMDGPVIGLAELPAAERSLDQALSGRRGVHFAAGRPADPCRVYSRDRLPAGQPIPGPAVVEEPTSTTLVLDGQTLSMTSNGILVIHDCAAEAS